MIRHRYVWIALVAAAAMASRSTQADERSDALKAKLEHWKDVFDKIPEKKRGTLSAGAQNLLALTRDTQIHEFPGGGDERRSKATAAPSPSVGADRDHEGGSVTRASDPSTDFVLAQLIGFTQSETSTAWCGRNVVVGFNDSGSFVETFPTTGGLSFSGVARSTDGGRTFTDQGALNPGPLLANFVSGDPVVVCKDESTFYYSNIFLPGFDSGMSVSTSTDGGQTFGDPQPAIVKNGFDHFLDKEWLGIDHANPSRLYLTYTDFDVSFGSAACGQDFRTAIEMVSSADGGVTWGAPVVVEEVCGFDPAVQGSQVVVGANGDVLVAWEHFDDFVTRDIRFRKSTDNGATFGATRVVAPVTCAGDCSSLRGGFRTGFEFPSLAVDNSNKPSAGTLYLAWNDGRLAVPEALSASGFYNHPDIVLSRSTDGGSTWSAPTPINRRPGTAHDQFQPGIAVDRRGDIGACFYDRQIDPGNFFIARTCQTSRDGGARWDDEWVGSLPWQPFHATDLVVNVRYMGDYDSLTSDGLSDRSGFLGAFSRQSIRGNPDVYANRVRR